MRSGPWGLVVLWGVVPVGPDLVCSGPGWGLWGAVPLGVVGPWGAGCIHLPWRQLKHNP